MAKYPYLCISKISQDMNEVALSGFLSGFATAYFTLYAYQLFRLKGAVRLQRVLACIFVQWAVFNLKDFLLTLPDYHDPTIQNVIVLIDGTSLIGYTLFIYELIRPGWATWRKASQMLAAYAPFFLTFTLWPGSLFIHCYIACLLIAGSAIFLVWLCDARRYARYIRDNYSSLEGIDISWLRVVAWFFVGCQLLWVVISVVRHPLTDCLYYVLSIVLWQATLDHVLHQQPVVMEPKEQEKPPTAREYSFAKSLPTQIETEELYLNPTLSVKELAAHLGTNRTYLSDYFVHNLNTTFYDYINSLRIEKKSIPLLNEFPNYTLERIAAESGFQSVSTFRRAFVKQKGVTPSEYRKQMQNK